MLELKNVSKIYKTKSQEVRALDNVSLYFEETGLIFITGKSGSGKTTLLNVIGGLDNFSEGEILIKDKSTKDFTKSDYDSYRNTYIGFVFQEYNLLDNMTVAKNISLATELQGKKDDKENIEKILEKVDLKDVSSRHPQELSGGQRQRVAIARALIKQPSIIMADEPTGSLDTENGFQIMTILKKLSKEKLVIVVSHDLELASKFADRIINLKDGRVESDITIKLDDKRKRNIVEKKDVVSIKRGAELKDSELQKIKSAVSKGKDVLVTDNINVIKKDTVITDKKSYDKSSPFIKTHLGFWDTIKLGLNTLRTKRFRLVVTILLCAIAFSVFGIFDAMSIYDEGRLSANTLKSSITPLTTITTNITEDNGNSYSISTNDTLVSTLSSLTGYDFKGVYNSYYIGTTTPDELKNNYTYTISKYYYYKTLRGAVEFSEDDIKNYNFSIVDGRLPESFDEIAVSKYFAYCMLNWSYKVPNEDNVYLKNLEDFEKLIDEENPLTLTLGTTGAKASYKIVGIIDTGTINKKFDGLKENFERGSSMDQNEFLDYINNGFFLYGFVKPGFVNNAIVDYNVLSKYINPAYNFEFVAKENSNISLDRKNFYNFEELSARTSNYVFIDPDKTSLQENEIMIDLSTFSTIYSDIITELKAIASNDPNFNNDVSNIDAYISDLTNKNKTGEEKIASLRSAIETLDRIQSAVDEVDGTVRTESVFQREFTAKKYDTSRYISGTTTNVEVKIQNNKYKIVGFYTGINIASNTSLVLSSTGLSNLGISLMQGNYTSLLATNLGKGNVNKLSSLLLNTSGLCYSCKNSTIALIRANSDFFENLSLLFLIVAGVFAVFSIVMFSNFISTSIKNKYTEIGILRALGASGADILKMFVVEAIAIALINAISACVVAAVGSIFVNMFLSNYLSLYIPLASFGIRQVLIMFGLSVLVGVVSAIIPISSVSRQKPVETIRKAF